MSFVTLLLVVTETRGPSSKWPSIAYQMQLNENTEQTFESLEIYVWPFKQYEYRIHVSHSNN